MSKTKNKTKLINCREAARLMNDYIDNYLKGSSKEELITHLNSCKHCFDKAEFGMSLKKKITSLAADVSEEKTARKKAEKILSELIK
jgi:hypothetical protein